MDWLGAKDTILLALAGYAAYQFREMANSVSELNIRIAVVVEKIAGHEDRIKRLEERS